MYVDYDEYDDFFKTVDVDNNIVTNKDNNIREMLDFIKISKEVDEQTLFALIYIYVIQNYDEIMNLIRYSHLGESNFEQILQNSINTNITTNLNIFIKESYPSLSKKEINSIYISILFMFVIFLTR